MKTKVFISYAIEDTDMANKLFADLERAGIEPWLDKKHLRMGQHWKKEIKHEISKCSYFIALLSSRSVGKRGYVQKEIRFALSIADEYPPTQTFIIPLRLDECEPSHERLRELQWGDLFPSYEKGLNDLLVVLNYQPEVEPLLVKASATGVVTALTFRGFGFISFIGEKDLFFHSKNLNGVTFEELRVGDVVTFEVIKGLKGDAAENVQRA